MNNKVIVIGDRSVGKTSMVVALAKSGTKHVKVVSDPEGLVARNFNVVDGKIAGTSQMKEETLLINVDLPSGERQIQVLWIDTPGEAFSNKDWKSKYPSAWQDIEQKISQSQGVILLLPPQRDLVQPHRLDDRTNPEDLPTQKAWSNRLETWLTFFSQNCAYFTQILICIHRADTFCNIELEGKKWKYNHSKQSFWYEYKEHIYRTYFASADNFIRHYNSRYHQASLQFFITTIEHPSLLELPWLYLGTYVAHTQND